MISLSHTPVYIAISPVDMRKSINGLSVLVSSEMNMNPLTGGVFVFSNRSRKIIKILYWHYNGFCILQKRLERGRFKWPQNTQEVSQIDSRQLSWLMEGLDIDKLKAHKQLNYTHLY